MRAAVAQIPSKSFRLSSSPDLTTKNAWAQLVRRRFYGQNLVKAVMREWGLTERQARGLVYAEASQNTIDTVLKRDPIKGFALSLEIAAIVTGIKLEEYLDYRALEAVRARTEWEAENRRITAMRARVSGCDGLAWRPADEVRSIRPEVAGLGDQAPSGTLEQQHIKPRRSGG